MPNSASFKTAGLTYRQLDHWTRQGYLIETGARIRNNSGVPRSWAQVELGVAKRMLLLIGAGLTVAKAAEVARNVNQAGCHLLGEHIWIDLRDGWQGHAVPSAL